MTTQEYFRGDTLGKILYFYNESNALFDPNTIAVIFKDPDGVTPTGGTLSISDLTQTATGTYKLKWNIPVDGVYGLWTFTVKATKTAGTLVNTEEFTFILKQAK